MLSKGRVWVGCMHRYPLNKHSQPGFSLVELLITLGILAILAGLGWPLYEKYRNRALRASAGVVLLQCAMRTEHRASLDFSYVGLDVDEDGVPDIDGCPDSVWHAGTRVYRIQVTARSEAAFEILAVPVAGSAVAEDGFLGIDQQGVRFWDKNNNGKVQAPDEHRWQD